MNKAHLGSVATIDLRDGQAYFENEKGGLIVGNLYKNYANECFKPGTFKRPKQNHYRLDVKKLSSIVSDVVLENMSEQLEEVSHASGQINCQVQ